MKNIRQYVLIAIAFILTFVVLVEHNIIQENKNNLLDKDYEISKLKEEHKKQIENLEDKLKEKEDTIEIYKEYMYKNWHPIEVDVQACMKKENYTTMGMSRCVLKSEDRWNNEIKFYISELKKLTNKKVGALLDNSQKDWEKYRDSQRKVIYNTIWNLQGTMHINISDGEAVYITEQRAKDLADILNMMKNGNYIQ